MKPATLEEVEQIVSERLAELERRIMPEALTVRDVARRLKLSVTRVNELVYSGQLPSYKVGNSRRVDPSDLAEFIAERRAAVTTAAPVTRVAGASSSDNWLADLRERAYPHG